MLLYAMLHLAGVQAVNADYERLGEPAVTLDDIKRFRQLDSKCPGHPEYRWTSGVETTTGPLGQGCGNSVGMAIGGALARAPLQPARLHAVRLRRVRAVRRRRHDGGRGQRGASIAGHLRLANLCWIYDSNRITIEGPTDLAFSEDVGSPVRGLWLERHAPGATPTTPSGSAARSRPFRRTDDRPTLIIVDSHIGYGAPHKQDTSAAHGEPLGEEEVRLAKRELRLARGREVPGARRRLRALPGGHRAARAPAARGMGGSVRALPQRSIRSSPMQLERMQRRELPEGWDADLPAFPADAKGIASREVLGQGAERASPGAMPWLIGGSADLAPSTKTRLTFEGAGDLAAENPGGRNLHFGIREHAMGAIVQRPGAVQAPRLRLGLPDLQRLHEAADPARPR